jgi:tRNA-specific 2-thiouridylase
MRAADGSAAGALVGEHVGLAFYTLGQRKGIGVGGRRDSSGAPWFVARKDVAANTLWIVQGHDHPWLMSTHLAAADAAWVAGKPPAAGTALTAKTRYRQHDAACTVLSSGSGTLELEFHAAQSAVTPGQSAVLYDGDVCLGGAVIDACAGPSKHDAVLGAGTTADTP